MQNIEYGLGMGRQEITPVLKKRQGLLRRATQLTSLLQIALLFLWTIVQQSLAAPVPGGIISITSSEIPKEGYLLELPYKVKILGEAMFSSLYVNSVGGVSFGSGISQSKLESTENKAIVFAPLLLQSDENAEIVIRYEFNDEEKLTLQQKFRDTTGVRNFVIENALTVFWSEHLGNSYIISFATDNEKTFVIYDYQQVNRTRDENGFAKAGIFALEDGSIICPLELPESGKASIADVKDFHARVDLPLECDGLEISCTVPPAGVESQLAARREGYYFETITVDEWSYYALYMCDRNRTKLDGSVTTKQTCADDPDYYEYDWSETTSADVCSVEVQPIRI